MEILGIGPLEFIVILVILLIVLGPNDMAKAGKTLGKWFRTLMMSDTWKAVTKTSRTIRDLPNTLARQASLDEIQDLKKDLEGDVKSISDDLPKVSDLDKYKKEIQSEMTSVKKAVETSPEPPPNKEE